MKVYTVGHDVTVAEAEPPTLVEPVEVHQAFYVVASNMDWMVWLVEVHGEFRESPNGLRRRGLYAKCRKIRLVWSFHAPRPPHPKEPAFVSIARNDLAFTDAEFGVLFEKGRQETRKQALYLRDWSVRRQQELAKEIEKAQESERSCDKTLERLDQLDPGQLLGG